MEKEKERLFKMIVDKMYDKQGDSSYLTEKHLIYTPEGLEKVLECYIKGFNALASTGAFKGTPKGVSGDGWLILNALDYLVDKGYFQIVSHHSVAGQDRVYIAGKKGVT